MIHLCLTKKEQKITLHKLIVGSSDMASNDFYKCVLLIYK